MATIGLILSGWGGAALLNGMMDISERKTHECTLMDKWVTHSKNSTTYHVRVTSWDPKFPSYQFSVPYGLYNQLENGDPCQVVSRAGYLRYEWVVSHGCSKRPVTIDGI